MWNCGWQSRQPSGTNDSQLVTIICYILDYTIIYKIQRPDACWEESLILEKFHGVSEEKSADEEMNGEEKNVGNVFAVFVVDLTPVMQAILQRYILQYGRRAKRLL